VSVIFYGTVHDLIGVVVGSLVSSALASVKGRV
jgi:hypothetical protein